MAFYSSSTHTYHSGSKPPEIDEKNPNRGFKRQKLLDNLESGKQAAKRRVAEQGITKAYVDKYVGTGIDITEVGDTTTVVLDKGKIIIGGVDQQYEERIDPETKIRHLVFKKKEDVDKQKAAEIKETARFKKWIDMDEDEKKGPTRRG